MIRIELPYHLRTLAKTGAEVQVEVGSAVTLRTVLDALEQNFPTLRGAIRDQVTGQRRPLVRFFACLEDISFQPADAPLPDPVAAGREPLLIVGAVAGG